MPVVDHLSRWTHWNSSIRDVEDAMLNIKAIRRDSFFLHCRSGGILDGIYVSYARDKNCRWTTVRFLTDEIFFVNVDSNKPDVFCTSY